MGSSEALEVAGSSPTDVITGVIWRTGDRAQSSLVS